MYGLSYTKKNVSSTHLQNIFLLIQYKRIHDVFTFDFGLIQLNGLLFCRIKFVLNFCFSDIFKVCIK